MKFILDNIEKAWRSGTLIGMASGALVPCCELWLEIADDSEVAYNDGPDPTDKFPNDGLGNLSGWIYSDRFPTISAITGRIDT